MIKLRPWKGTKNEFEVDVIVSDPNGTTLRRRVKAPVTGRSAAERWARSLEQELLGQLLAPKPEPERPPPPTFEEFAVSFLDMCRGNRLAINTLMNYEAHLRLYLVPVLGKRRLDAVKPSDITAIKASLASKARAFTRTVTRAPSIAYPFGKLMAETADIAAANDVVAISSTIHSHPQTTSSGTGRSETKPSASDLQERVLPRGYTTGPSFVLGPGGQITEFQPGKPSSTERRGKTVVSPSQAQFDAAADTLFSRRQSLEFQRSLSR